MRTEINQRLAILVIAIIVGVLGVAAWRMFATPSGLRSPKEAGLGRPMKPGEIPGKSSGTQAPVGLPPR
jgi:hypothetical protein